MRPSPETTGPGRLCSRATVLVALVACVSCAAHRPSKEPLGWGPIAPGMRTDPPPLAHQTSPGNKGEPPGERREETATEAADAGGRSGEAVAEERPKEAPPAPGERGPSAPEGTQAAVTAKAFAGDYAGEDVSTYHLEGIPERVDRDPNAKITARSEDEHAASFVLIDSSNGKEICTLSASTTGNVATLKPGERCFEQSEGEQTASAVVRSGTVTADREKLTMDVDFAFTMSLGDRDFEGTLQYHFEGTRK